MIDGIELVGFESNDRVLQRHVEPAASSGVHQDALAVEMEVDGQHGRERAGREPDATQGRQREQPQAFLAVEDLEPIAVELHGSDPAVEHCRLELEIQNDVDDLGLRHGLGE